jgi:hypothetical protein
MTVAATIPTLGVGGSGRAGRFSLLVVLRVHEREMVDPTGDVQSPLVKAAVIKEDEVQV